METASTSSCEPGPPSEAASVRAARDQRTSAVKALFEAHAAFVWRTLRRLGVPPSDLEDATQEVFLVVFRRWESYEERSTPRAWLYAVCIRVSMGHRRSLRRRRELPAVEAPELSVEATQLRHVELGEAKALGEELLALLPEKQRTVFLLYEVEHMTMPEIAETLGFPVQTGYARLHKARERVIAELRRAQRRGRLS